MISMLSYDLYVITVFNFSIVIILTRPDHERREKILNCYFHSSFWCLIKPFDAPQIIFKIKI